ncbi:protein of unknown function [Burkholderia multivorans]
MLVRTRTYAHNLTRPVILKIVINE